MPHRSDDGRRDHCGQGSPLGHMLIHEEDGCQGRYEHDATSESEGCGRDACDNAREDETNDRQPAHVDREDEGLSGGSRVRKQQLNR